MLQLLFVQLLGTNHSNKEPAWAKCPLQQFVVPESVVSENSNLLSQKLFLSFFDQHRTSFYTDGAASDTSLDVTLHLCPASLVAQLPPLFLQLRKELAFEVFVHKEMVWYQ
ncbi:hypothetical protein AAZX31_07G096100 [Glycine max]